MSRPLFLGNGRMLVGVNRFGMVHDFYYPYVGLENHTAGTGLRHKIGVWVDGAFSWLDDGSWEFDFNYEENAMMGSSSARNDNLNITVSFDDFVDHEYTVFGRTFTVQNNVDHDRQIRLFVHQVFQIAESARGDTALYIPDENVILDYKGSRAFTIYSQEHDGEPFDEYSIGNFGIEGKEGTYKDAEDGSLEANPVEHGHIDSVVRHSLDLGAHASKKVDYWVSAAVNNVEVVRIHNIVKKQGLAVRRESTRKHWGNWLKKAQPTIQSIPPEHQSTFKKSLFIMKSHMDARGAVIASGDSRMLNYARDYYSYCWPRDAAHVLWPLVRMGFTEEPKAYFEFARDVLTADGYFMHKYLPDRSIGSSWHPYVHEHHKELPIQEDETAITLFLLGEYMDVSGDNAFVESLYTTLVRPAANFMENYIDKQTRLPHASYDLWEERFQTTTYSVGVVYGGLMAAAKMANAFSYPDDAIRWETLAADIKNAAQTTLYNNDRKYFYRGFLLNEQGMLEFDDVVDVASFYGATQFGLFDLHSDLVVEAMSTMEKVLGGVSPIGGFPRYEYDQYNRSDPPHLGNPWFVTTLWHAQYMNKIKKTEVAVSALAWTQSHMLSSGVLPEQIHPETGEHISVAPLIWSHAEYVTTLLDTYTKK